MARKYVKGKKIESFDRLVELVNQNKSVFWGGKVINAAWVQNQMLRTLLNCNFYETDEAISKTITGGIFPTGDPKDKEVNLLIIKPLKSAIGIKFNELPNLKKIVISNGNKKVAPDFDLIISVVKQCKRQKIEIEIAKSVVNTLSEQQIYEILNAE